MGLTHDALLERHDHVNLLNKFPGKGDSSHPKGDAFPMAKARIAAKRLRPRLAGRHVILVGDNVRAAFGFKRLGWFKPQVVELRRGSTKIVVVPHTSGVCRWWNDRSNMDEARRFFGELRDVLEGKRMAEKTIEDQQRTLPLRHTLGAATPLSFTTDAHLRDPIAAAIRRRDRARVSGTELFKDVVEFHKKYELMPEWSGHEVPLDRLMFRLRAMFEEMFEFCDAIGAVVEFDENGLRVILDPAADRDVHGAFDALIDMTYFNLGTAVLFNFPFEQGWARVHAANMQKIRAESDADPLSKRKSKFDVVKPPGWKAPDLTDLLKIEASEEKR